MQKTREEILRKNQVFTEHFLKVQEAKYSPDGNEYSEGDKVILDEGAVTLTKEKAEELNREDIDNYERKKDISSFNTELNVEWIGRKILVPNNNDFENYFKEIGLALDALTSLFKTEKLFILGNLNTPWLFQENEYPPVKKASDYLKSKVNIEFNGGFELSENELIDFIPHLFWLIRCNMSLPEFMMSFENSKTIFSIYKHGNLNLEFYDNKEKEMILSFFKARGFRQIDDYYDTIEFDNFDGRGLIV